MINLLDLISQEVAKPELDHVVFTVALRDFGVDDETIDDCLAMPADRREWLLTYFEGKK